MAKGFESEQDLHDSDKCCIAFEACPFLHDNREFEVEQNSSMSKVSVKGRLQNHRHFWHDIGANQWVMDCILEGYKLPFRVFPLPARFPNNRSAAHYSDFVSNAILELLADGRIKQVDTAPLVISPLSVADNVPGKLRLVLDLKYVNTHLVKQSIKYEDWKYFMQYVEAGGYAYKLDLKSGYHHVDIFSQHQTYLGFSWKFPGQKSPTFFTFSCLPFGLSTAPHAFCKVMRPIVGYIRSHGVKFVLFLDDGAGTNKSQIICKQEANFVVNTFNSAGLVINSEKSDFTCGQCLEWVGLVWNLKENKLEIPERRLLSLHDSLKKVVKHNYFVSARKIASIIGKIISMTPSVGNISRLLTRQLHVVVNSRSAWDRKMYIGNDKLAVLEITFWLQNIRNLSGSRAISLKGKPPETLGFSDASSVAGASFIVQVHGCNENNVAHRMWTEEEKCQSSTHRELAALLHGLESFASYLSGKVVQWGTDNQNVVKITDVGSMKSELQQLALQIFALCMKENIRLHVTWFPRNTHPMLLADQLSRIVDYDDWSISTQCFEYFNHLHGPFTCDRFADSTNAKCKLFNSRFYSPGCVAVDAFCQNWADHINWVVPPVSLVARCISHFIECKAKGMLVAPKWTSQLFYPLLFDGHGKPRQLVQCWYEVKNLHGVLTPGKCNDSIIHPEKLKSPLLFLWIDCIAC